MLSFAPVVDWSFPFWEILITALVTVFTIRVSVREARKATQQTLDAQRQSDLDVMLGDITGIVTHERGRRGRRWRTPQTQAQWDALMARLWFSGVEGATSVATWLRQADDALARGDLKQMKRVLGNNRLGFSDFAGQVEKNLQGWFVSPEYAREFEAHIIPVSHYSCPD